ncbi:hypothetical protein FTO70_14460 [Methanosarcina sp. KYL-1]|uniref:DUF7544 domain-containing protein n=1 Tax=Methanosarcina sp. KYL-1 TaxID=2602068 RepID=UPI002101A986|nr:hypothetical protein [Methanosarcina sp. KYL-1]MCQ1536850.1 hypothetical protein [Methanosarcina sp. KYL-1]
MGWYSIDAVDRAFSRTRKALFEPFDFWKWAKLALIIFLLGGVSSNYGGSGTNYRMSSEDFGDTYPGIGPDRMPELPFDANGFDPAQMQFPEIAGFLIAGIVILLLIALFFSYVSSVMEFVFVEALVRNEVYFWAYSRKFLNKGFYLLLIRFALGLVFLVLFGIALLPLFLRMLESSQDFSWPVLVGGIFWFIGVIAVLALLGSAINSFLGLAIPVSIYRETGILSAFKLVFGNFRKSWQEVLVYWIVRFVLGIGVAILAVILVVLLMLAFGLVFLILDGVLYFLFSAFLSGPLLWVLLIPFVLVELLLVFIVLLLLNVPFATFIKYHMLSFLDMWYAEAGIPFFDKLSVEPEYENSF